ncbi:MAG: RnfABCDGE type electron transport complex subunit B [Candidatus Omnitrophica bacterium]|nr:RnfABCDGE type electron transport complex subunit B [Candidatus Omnitrophota bacterium]
MLIPILIMSIMGLLFGLALAFASRIFRVELDPKIEKILSALPGANCGACGKAGCAGLAEAIAKGDTSLTSCPAADKEAYNKIADILGVEKQSIAKKIARIRCGGGKSAKDKYIYQGVKTCSAVSLIAGGKKSCNFGCLGFGDCVIACPFDAIHMQKDGIPIVDPETCIACGKCVKACPKNIISLEDADLKYYVRCLSRDKAGFVKNACKVGCIACKICEKLSQGVFIIEDNLSRIDYNKADDKTPWELCIEKCPTKCIVAQ